MPGQIDRRQMLAMSAAAMATPCPINAKSEPFIRGVARAEAGKIAAIGEAFREKFDLPGVSLAMAYRGQLKLLACFGLADRKNRVAVAPKHQFRIASVSKPITSVTILKLAEQRRLKLGDRVLAEGGVLRGFVPELPAQQQKRVEEITVRHLLEHSCGGWSNNGPQAPMFARPALGMSHPELIAWTLKNVELKNDPGTRYAYSNFGYCLLGRVIEAVTKQNYEQAVKTLVLQPAGAKATHVGGHKRNERRRDEVVYYDQFDPYGANMDVRRMDAHGGWISTATDLVRFAQCVDGFPVPKDLLMRTTLKQMTTAARGSYAFGWSVNKSKNWWHNGAFNGGTSILARINDGHSWAVLVNTRPRNSAYHRELDAFPWTVKRAISKWGTHNLFSN